MKYKSLSFVLLGLIAGVILTTSVSRIQKKDLSPSTTPSVAGQASQNQDFEEFITSPTPVAEILVTKVIDGDTIEIEGGKRVRLIGIDTPETVDPRTTVQCFGKEASNKTRELLEGKKVRLEKDISETDRYGRLLRYIYFGEIFINEVLIRDGYAISSSYPPDIKHQENLKKAEAEARLNNRGLWSVCNTPAPSSSSTTSNQTSQTDVSTQTVQRQTVSGECTIKGNISSSGEKIYHMPDQNFYNRTVIEEGKGERWFCSESEATSAGWRKSKT